MGNVEGLCCTFDNDQHVRCTYRVVWECASNDDMAQQSAGYNQVLTAHWHRQRRNNLVTAVVSVQSMDVEA
jgi:hypothetical protein